MPQIPHLHLRGRLRGVQVDTFSSCVDDITNRVITLVGSTINAKQTSIDVGGAYFHGTPPTMDEGGRLLFAVSPPGSSTSAHTPRLTNAAASAYS